MKSKAPTTSWQIGASTPPQSPQKSTRLVPNTATHNLNSGGPGSAWGNLGDGSDEDAGTAKALDLHRLLCEGPAFHVAEMNECNKQLYAVAVKYLKTCVNLNEEMETLRLKHDERMEELQWRFEAQLEAQKRKHTEANLHQRRHFEAQLSIARAPTETRPPTNDTQLIQDLAEQNETIRHEFEERLEQQRTEFEAQLKEQKQKDSEARTRERRHYEAPRLRGRNKQLQREVMAKTLEVEALKREVVFLRDAQVSHAMSQSWAQD